MIRILHPDDAFSEMFELEASTEEGQPLQGKIRKGEKGRPLFRSFSCQKSLDILISAHTQAQIS